jgi:acetyl/propionyl-CoA carboxylase alpha subunit
MRKRFQWGGQVFQVDVLKSEPLTVRIQVDEQGREVHPEGRLQEGEGRVLIGGAYHPYYVTRDLNGVWVTLSGETFFLEDAKKDVDLAEALDHGFEAPMPGKVIKVSVSKGEKVEKGQVLVLKEALAAEAQILDLLV